MRGKNIIYSATEDGYVAYDISNPSDKLKKLSTVSGIGFSEIIDVSPDQKYLF